MVINSVPVRRKQKKKKIKKSYRYTRLVSDYIIRRTVHFCTPLCSLYPLKCTTERVRLYRPLTTTVVCYLVERAHRVQHGVVLSPFVHNRRPFVQRVPIHMPPGKEKKNKLKTPIYHLYLSRLEAPKTRSREIDF